MKQLITVVLCVAGFSAVICSSLAVDLQVPGEGWRKVRLTYEARVTNDMNYEEHPEYEIMPRIVRLPTCRIDFVPAQAHAWEGIGSFRNAVWSREWRNYVREMWLPPGVERLSVGFGKKDAVEARKFCLDSVTDGKIAVNGDFSLGAYNYSGFMHHDRNGRVEPASDGRGALNTCPDGALSTEPFPLTAGKEYRLVITWDNRFKPKPMMRIQQNFYDKDGKLVKAACFNWFAKPPKGWKRTDKESVADIVSTYDFGVKEGVVAGSVVFYEGIVKSYKIEEVNE